MGVTETEMMDIKESSQGHFNRAFVTTPGDAQSSITPEGEEPISTPPTTKEEHAGNVARAEEKTSITRTEHNKGAKSIDLGEKGGQGSPRIRNQVVCAVLAAMSHVAIGTCLGLPGVILPQLTDPTSHDLFLDTSQVALYGSLLHVGVMAGSLLGGVFNVYLGQRVTLLVAMPFLLALWLCMAFASGVWILQLVRTLLGITNGFIGIASTNYVAEVTQPELRGRLMSFLDIGRQVGILLVYMVGCLHLTWREVMMVCGCITTLPTFIGLIFIPNSPRWLVTKDRMEEAHKAIGFLRGPHYDPKVELQAITDHFHKSMGNKVNTMGQVKQMREPNIIYRLAFMSVLTILAQLTGNIAIVTYGVPIFQAANSSMNSYGSAVSIATLRVVGSLAFMLLVKRFGCRVLMISSSLVCSVSLLLLGIYFLLQNLGTDVSTMGWLPLASLLVYMPFVVPIQAIIAILRSEFFSTSMRAMAVSIMFVVFSMSMFIVAQVFPLQVEAIGEHGVFWTYAIACLLLALITTVLLPETRGLTLEEVDDRFKYGKKIVVPIPCV